MKKLNVNKNKETMTIGMVFGLYVYVLFSLKKNRKKIFPILSLLLKVQK